MCVVSKQEVRGMIGHKFRFYCSCFLSGFNFVNFLFPFIIESYINYLALALIFWEDSLKWYPTDIML